MIVSSSVACSTAAHRALLCWYQRQRRDLPWRHSRDPYHIWISEIMLQQTQVATVLQRYPLWLRQFPSLPAVASAGEDAVLRAWQGLGYYRRARLLYQAATIVMAHHEGVFPRDFDAMVALPGIGRSTAGAIASICFDAPHPVLDANVRRVLTRWRQPASATDRQLWLLAEEALQQSGEPAYWNQAMMELGACCCKARQAACMRCPLEPYCASAHQPLVMPSTAPKRVETLHWRIRIHHHPQRGTWMVQRPHSGIWGGLWSPPIESFTPESGERKPDLVHQLTHRRLHLYAAIEAQAPVGDGRWVVDPGSVAMPVGIQRLFAQLGNKLGVDRL